MFTVRWVTAQDSQKPAMLRDENYATKKDALEAISRVKIATISRLGKMYVVTPRK